MDGFIGEIRAFPYNFIPKGWLACDGSRQPVSKYRVLYAVMGSLYGGDEITFNVPNLSGTKPPYLPMKYGICYMGAFPVRP